MKRFLFFLILLAFTREGVLAQMNDFFWGDYKNIGNNDQTKLTGFKYNYDAHSSAHYFFQPDWYSGTLLTREGETHEGIRLRYDAFNDELIAYNENIKGLFVVDKFRVNEFTIRHPRSGDQVFRRLPLTAMGQKEHYYQVLYEGNITLLRRNRIIEKKTSLYKNKYGKLDNRDYVLVQVSFIITPDNEVLRIFPGRRSITGLFPDRKKEVRKVLREYNIVDYSIDGIPLIVRVLDNEGLFGPGI